MYIRHRAFALHVNRRVITLSFYQFNVWRYKRSAMVTSKNGSKANGKTAGKSNGKVSDKSPAKRMSQTEVMSHFAEKFDIKRAQVKEIFGELTELVGKEVKKKGEFTLPGF